MMKTGRGLSAAGLLAMAALSAGGGSPLRVPVEFQTMWDVGAGRAVFVVGSHADVGGWSPTGAVKLCWTAGNVWTGRVAVQAGTALEYKFIARTNTTGTYCNVNNVEWTPGDNLSVQVPAQPEAPYAGKTILYHSRWTNANILYKVGTNFVGTDMERIGAGRAAGEYLYRLSGIGEAGEPIEFVPFGWTAGGLQEWDNSPYSGYGLNNYYTPFDVFFLQDKHVFNYGPPLTCTAARIVLTNVASSVAGIDGRTVRIYLPRGYDTNTWKRYPVLYLHDGQNVYSPGGAFGSWDADLIATREMSQGRMREAILVGIDNTPARLQEYCPPGDSAGYGPGLADQYANFVIHNVRPTIDTHFRTLNDKANTLVLGSSMGGLVSAYFGFETSVFGKIGVVSPSFWAAPNFVGRINSNDVHGLRVYMDCGTGEGSSMFADMWKVHDYLLRDRYAWNDDLLTVVGCGQEHKEAAWASRLPRMYHYLLNVWDEANGLVHREWPPVLSSPGAPGLVAFDAQVGWTYRLDRAASLVQPAWNGVATSAVETLPWQPRALWDPAPPAGSAVYRLSASP